MTISERLNNVRSQANANIAELEDVNSDILKQAKIIEEQGQQLSDHLKKTQEKNKNFEEKTRLQQARISELKSQYADLQKQLHDASDVINEDVKVLNDYIVTTSNAPLNSFWSDGGVGLKNDFINLYKTRIVFLLGILNPK